MEIVTAILLFLHISSMRTFDELRKTRNCKAATAYGSIGTLMSMHSNEKLPNVELRSQTNLLENTDVLVLCEFRIVGSFVRVASLTSHRRPYMTSSFFARNESYPNPTSQSPEW